jgi:HEAT repeat protein
MRGGISALVMSALLFSAAAAAAAAPPAPSVAELVQRLPACQSLETCEAALELTRRGEAIWPDIEVGLGSPDEWIRFWTLGVLTNVPVAAAREAIAKRLDDGAVRVRAAAAFALGEQRDRAVTPALLRALADKDLNVRFAAAVALGKIKDPAAVPALIAACRDRDEDVRAHAAAALGETGDRRATAALLERLDQDIVPLVRGYAAMALGQLRDPASLVPLLAHADEEKDASALAATAAALGELRDPAALPKLKLLLLNPSEGVVDHVRYAIALIQAAQKKKAGGGSK